MSYQINANIPNIPALRDKPLIAPPELVRPSLQDIMMQTNDTTDKTLSDLQNVKDEIKLNFPEKTSLKTIDDKNLEDCYDTLQQIRPDLFIDEDPETPDDLSMHDLGEDFLDILDIPSLEDIPSERPGNLIDQINLSYPEKTGIAGVHEKHLQDYYDALQQIRPDLFTSDGEEVEEETKPDLSHFMARVTYVLVPTDVKIDSDDPADILADPNVTTIIPPIVQESYDDVRPINTRPELTKIK